MGSKEVLVEALVYALVAYQPLVLVLKFEGGYDGEVLL